MNLWPLRAPCVERRGWVSWGDGQGCSLFRGLLFQTPMCSLGATWIKLDSRREMRGNQERLCVLGSNFAHICFPALEHGMTPEGSELEKEDGERGGREGERERVCVCGGGGRGEERQEVRINIEPGMLGNGIFKGVLATFLRWKLSAGFSQLKLPLAEWPCHRDNS